MRGGVPPARAGRRNRTKTKSLPLVGGALINEINHTLLVMELQQEEIIKCGQK